MEETPMRSVMERVPFDVLGDIFDYYVEKESFTSPLETMLLVCRKWNRAAVGYPALWTRFRIIVGHEPCPTVWLARLPLRLSRSGSSIPFEIDIHSAFDMQKPPFEDNFDILSRAKCKPANSDSKNCECSWKARQATRRLLSMLAGPSGIYCKRWKTLHLSLGPNPIREYGQPIYSFILGEALSFPTPLLTSLLLERFEYTDGENFPFLPYIPQLRHFQLWLGDILPPLDLSLIRVLDIHLSLAEDPCDLSHIAAATNLEDLTITYFWEDFVLPDELPQLHSLKLTGGNAPLNARLFKAPMLKKLTLHFEEADAVDEFLRNEQLAHEIEELKISCYYISETIVSSFSNLMTRFLQSSWKLRYLGSCQLWLGVCLKIFCDANAKPEESDWIHMFDGKPIALCNHTSGAKAVLSLPASTGWMIGLADTLKVAHPNQPWDTLSKNTSDE